MEPLEVVLRPLEVGDDEAVVLLWQRARSQAFPELEARMGHSADDDRKHFSGFIARHCDVWVAVQQSTVIGFIALGAGSIEQLFVAPEFQGRGVGTRLLKLAMQTFPEGFSLFTHQANGSARRFYEHHGFRVVRLGVSPAPESEPDVLYAWRS
jgi:ribosomal protein S18 acetylase RimI-like enzyme